MSVATLTTELLGGRAKGGFGPKTAESIDRGTLAALRGDEFIVTATQDMVGGCGDERLDAQGSRLLLPPVFGGWFAVVLADALTTRLWYRPGMTALQHAEMMADQVKSMRLGELCTHTDEHAVASHAEECGCAAIAKAATVLQLLITEFADLIDSACRDEIIQNGKELLESGYFEAGTAHFVEALEKDGVHKEILIGDHQGIAFVENDDEGKIYDRPSFYAWCREYHDDKPIVFFFEYAKWAARITARKLMPDANSAARMFSAIDAFNKAVPFVICNPNMVIIKRIRSQAA